MVYLLIPGKVTDCAHDKIMTTTCIHTQHNIKSSDESMMRYHFEIYVLLTVVLLKLAGLFSNHGPLYFVSTKVSFSKLGLACHIAKIHSEVYNNSSYYGKC